MVVSYVQNDMVVRCKVLNSSATSTRRTNRTERYSDTRCVRGVLGVSRRTGNQARADTLVLEIQRGEGGTKHRPEIMLQVVSSTRGRAL